MYPMLSEELARDRMREARRVARDLRLTRAARARGRADRAQVRADRAQVRADRAAHAVELAVAGRG